MKWRGTRWNKGERTWTLAVGGEGSHRRCVKKSTYDGWPRLKAAMLARAGGGGVEGEGEGAGGASRELVPVFLGVYSEEKWFLVTNGLCNTTTCVSSTRRLEQCGAIRVTANHNEREHE